MSISFFLVACWLYAGRSLLLGLLYSFGALSEKYWSVPIAIAIGLLISPIALSVASLWSDPYAAALVTLILIDLFLLAIIVQVKVFKFGCARGYAYVYLIFVSFVGIISWLNGPYIEHLSDAWWHMRSVSWLVNNESLTIPFSVASLGFLEHTLSTLGADYSSYRLQAVLSVVADRSILDSWVTSSVVTSILLGVSIIVLFSSLNLSYLALCLSLIIWLLVLGGMNTGLRLTGWPAGMGYVYLNLGLVACYQLYCDVRSAKSWYLFFICLLGTFFFHYAELFLLVVAFSSTLLVKFLFHRLSIAKSLGMLALTSGCLLLAFTYAPNTNQAILPAYSGTFLILCSAWCVSILIQHTNLTVASTISFVIVATVSYLIIDWQHLSALFHPEANNNQTYYSGYIPHYKMSWTDEYLIISKWEHQLRASILWSGVIGLFLSLWMFLEKRDLLSQWLLTLMLVPWLVLVSPSAFTTLSSVVPIYGTYRVQFLMPVAVVLGLAASSSIKHLFNSASSQNIYVSDAESKIFNRLYKWISQNTIYVLSLAVALFFLYKLSVAVLNNFSDFIPPEWLGSIILLLGIIAAILKTPVQSAFSFVLLFVCILVAVPDSMVRLGVLAERPWAIYSNLKFHWRFADNRDEIWTHSSFRYQNDINAIRDSTISNDNSPFLSDIATSYYLAAETNLRPVVQQAHHSTAGLRYKEVFDRFCNNEISGTELHSQISQFNQRKKGGDSSNIQFIIINTDTLNYTAELLGTSCVGETDHLIPELEKISRIYYKGEYLILWKIEN